MHGGRRSNGKPVPAFGVRSSPFLVTTKNPFAPNKCRRQLVVPWRCTTTLPPVIFVLGGPGSGKGTQCALLVAEFGFEQVCAGDLLRLEAKSGSAIGNEVAATIRAGEIVPGEVTIGLLRDALMQRTDAEAVLIDGFPRAMDQALLFESAVTECEFALFFKCDVEEMKSRLLKRSTTSGRVDDDAAVVEKRLKTHMEKTMPVVKYYRKKGLLREVDANIGSASEVYKLTRSHFERVVL